MLAAEFGCHITCVERFDGFIEVARERSAAAGLDHLIDIVAADASKFEVDPERYDAALCIGASFVYGGLVPTLTVLRPGVRGGGHVAVGEVFWHAPPPADLEDYGAGSFSERFGLFETAGLPVVSVIAASDDDWDRYDTLHYVAIEDWLAEHGSEDGAAEIRAASTRPRSRTTPARADSSAGRSSSAGASTNSSTGHDAPAIGRTAVARHAPRRVVGHGRVVAGDLLAGGDVAARDERRGVGEDEVRVARVVAEAGRVVVGLHDVAVRVERERAVRHATRLERADLASSMIRPPIRTHTSPAAIGAVGEQPEPRDRRRRGSQRRMQPGAVVHAGAGVRPSGSASAWTMVSVLVVRVIVT